MGDEVFDFDRFQTKKCSNFSTNNLNGYQDSKIEDFIVLLHAKMKIIQKN